MFSFSEAWIFVFSIFFTIDKIRFHCFYILYSIEVLGFFFLLSFLYIPQNIIYETNLSWLVFELIKALESKTLIVFYLSFPNSTILCFFFFFFIIDLYFLIPAVTAQVFIPVELVIPTGTQTNESNTEIETQAVIEASFQHNLNN